MEATFEVPGTLTLADVSRAPKGETIEARMRRLAQKAVIEGCRIVVSDRSGRALVTSGTSNAVYVVDRRAEKCNCPAGTQGIPCKHLALALAVTTEPEPPAPACHCQDCHDTGRVVKPSHWFPGKTVEGFCPACTAHVDLATGRYHRGLAA